MACAALAVLAISLTTIGCGAGGDSSKGSVGISGCENVEPSAPRAVSYRPPKQTVTKGEKLTAVVETSCGTFEIALDSKRAPKTVNSFVFLSEMGFYDGLQFDRAAPGSFLEGGKAPTPGGGPGYGIEGEEPANLRYTRGLVVMAQSPRRAPGTVSSAFFIVLAPYLNFRGPPLGTIATGFDVLERIAKLGPPVTRPPNRGSTGVIGNLRQTVLIEGVSIEKG